MADISYIRSFSHVDWIDNEDVVQAGGENGFNKKFRELEAELDRISAVFGERSKLRSAACSNWPTGSSRIRRSPITQ